MCSLYFCPPPGKLFTVQSAHLTLDYAPRSKRTGAEEEEGEKNEVLPLRRDRRVIFSQCRPRKIVGPPCGFSWYDINLGVEHALLGILLVFYYLINLLLSLLLCRRQSIGVWFAM